MKTLSQDERETCMLQEPGWFAWVKDGKQAGIEIALLIVKQVKGYADSAPTVITAAFPNRVEMGLGLKREPCLLALPVRSWRTGNRVSPTPTGARS